MYHISVILPVIYLSYFLKRAYHMFDFQTCMYIHYTRVIAPNQDLLIIKVRQRSAEMEIYPAIYYLNYIYIIKFQYSFALVHFPINLVFLFCLIDELIGLMI